MPNPVAALGGASLLGGVLQSEAAGEASAAQAAASEAGIAEQRRQFDALRELLQPYTEAGIPALEQQQALLGLSGGGAQRQAIESIANMPMFQSQVQQGEEALLQRASATGGLRGGNIQGALAQFRPQMLNQAIQQRFANLGGLTSLGQQSAAGVGTAGMQTGTNIANLLAQKGQAQAGASLAQGQAFAQPLQLGSNLALLSGLGAF